MLRLMFQEQTALTALQAHPLEMASMPTVFCGPNNCLLTGLRTSEGAVRPKHDGKPRIDPMFVKAIAGHMYVIHVVHETDDFYVVFRVENVERGSYCTISWKMVPDPATQSVQDKK